MKKTFAAALLAAVPLLARAAEIPDPPAIDAKSYVVIDYASGDVLASRDADARVEPASITKVMLTYVVYDEIRQGRLKPDDEVIISEKAWRQGIDSSESRMFLNIGSKVKLQDLIHGIVIQSGNDASIAVAEHVAGSEQAFAELMNQYAKKLGMKNTHYSNAPGMPAADHYSTAHDLAILGRALIRDFPEEYKVYAQNDFVYNGIRQGNRNILLGMDPGADGIKTGHTSTAGYCLLSSIKRDDRRLIATVMGTPSMKYRAQASLELMNWAFRFFDSVDLFGSANPVTSVRAWKGAEDVVPVGTVEPVGLTLPRGGKEGLQLTQEITGRAIAPISVGQPVGTITISLNGKVLRQLPLVTLKEIPKGGLWRRMWDQIRLWFGA